MRGSIIVVMTAPQVAGFSHALTQGQDDPSGAISRAVMWGQKVLE